MEYRTFVIPRHIHYGAGALNRLSTVTCQRALITTDRVIRELGIVERVESILRTNGAETRIFDQIEAEPSKETAWKAFHLAQEFGPDLFVGLGGGSCMDVGKVAWVLYEHPDLASWPVADLAGAVGSRELRTKARYVAIPTTSGSASEVSGAAIFIDWEVHPPLKTGVFSEQLVPDVAILDPELTLTMPPTVTADCGYDALIHAVEGYVTSIDHPSEMRDTFALRAANTIFEWLPRAVADGRDLQAREKIHLASLQAGMAMQGGTLATTTAATGPGEQSGPRWPPAPIHVPSHAMGAAFRIPHGRANAFLLCPVFAFLYPTHKARLCSLATSLGIAGEDDRTQISNLLDALDQLKQKVGIPLSIRDSGVDETRWLEQVDLLATDTCSRSGAADVGLSVNELKEIYMHAWNGTRAELKE